MYYPFMHTTSCELRVNPQIQDDRLLLGPIMLISRNHLVPTSQIVIVGQLCLSHAAEAGLRTTGIQVEEEVSKLHDR